MSRSIAVGFCAVLLKSTLATGAEINLVPATPGLSPIVTISGRLDEGDYDSFLKALPPGPDRDSVIALNSAGGSVFSALLIGTVIRANKLRTYVPDGFKCYSACALIWIAGDKKYYGLGASIGFHAVYDIGRGEKKISAPGNALVGAYLSRLGYSNDLISYATTADPDSLEFLSAARLASLGIDAAPLSFDEGVRLPPVAHSAKDSPVTTPPFVAGAQESRPSAVSTGILPDELQPIDPKLVEGKTQRAGGVARSVSAVADLIAFHEIGVADCRFKTKTGSRKQIVDTSSAFSSDFEDDGKYNTFLKQRIDQERSKLWVLGYDQYCEVIFSRLLREFPNTYWR